MKLADILNLPDDQDVTVKAGALKKLLTDKHFSESNLKKLLSAMATLFATLGVDIGDETRTLSFGKAIKAIKKAFLPSMFGETEQAKKERNIFSEAETICRTLFKHYFPKATTDEKTS